MNRRSSIYICDPSTQDYSARITDLIERLEHLRSQTDPLVPAHLLIEVEALISEVAARELSAPEWTRLTQRWAQVQH